VTSKNASDFARSMAYSLLLFVGNRRSRSAAKCCEMNAANERSRTSVALSRFRVAPIGRFKNLLYLKALFYFRALEHNRISAPFVRTTTLAHDALAGFDCRSRKRFLRINFVRGTHAQEITQGTVRRCWRAEKKFRWKRKKSPRKGIATVPDNADRANHPNHWM